MRVTIVPDDQVVIVDGEATKIFIPQDSGIHAIQWDSDRGVIERKKGAAEVFTDFSVVQPYLDGVVLKKAEVAAEVAEPKETPPRKTLVDLILDDPAELAKLKTALGLV